jgi:predicted DCC family thiol-disulfide oxidoreductase YuxK
MLFLTLRIQQFIENVQNIQQFWTIMVVKLLFGKLPRDRYSRIFVGNCYQLFGDHFRQHGIIYY